MMLNLVHLTRSIGLDGGGVANAVKGQADALTKIGVKNCILTSHSFGGFSSNSNSKILSHLNDLRSAWGALTKLGSEIRRIGPNVLHSHGLWTITSIASQLATHNPPYLVVSPHGMLDRWALCNSRRKKWIAEAIFERRHLDKAAVIHALSEDEYLSIRKFGLRNPVCVIPNGVSLGEYATPKLRSRVLRKLLFLGRVHPKKGLRELVQAAYLSRDFRKAWQIVIAGWDDGNCLETVIRLATELNLRFQSTDPSLNLHDTFAASQNAEIVFVGPVTGIKKTELLNSCDAFILPSFSEGLPVAVLEAWAAKLPALITPACNLPEGFICGAARMIEPNADSISAALFELNSTSEHELEAMGQAGYDLVSQKFTWESIAYQLMQVYEWVEQRNAEPKCIRLS